ncbi:MAG: hypothetical protein CMP23_16470 [Rickettsiales bacterium]|nr:hypothetical protein [Rickettsiales bacterium]
MRPASPKASDSSAAKQGQGSSILRGVVQRLLGLKPPNRRRPATQKQPKSPPPRAAEQSLSSGQRPILDPDSAAAARVWTCSRDHAPELAEQPAQSDATLPTITSTDELELLSTIPGFLQPPELAHTNAGAAPSCAFCGVGDSEDERGRPQPTPGCAKLKLSTGKKGQLFPIHTAPSIQSAAGRARHSISYQQAVARFADLILDHRDPGTQVLVYGCGQIDYFTVFALQEVFRLLGVRNLAGNAEHCLNAGAVHNEMLTGQEGPFLTFDNAFSGNNRFYLLNGWNGMISHPGAWARLIAQNNPDAYVIDVMESESALALAQLIGKDRVILIRPRSDAHMALAVAHQLITKHQAPHPQFIARFSDPSSWDHFLKLASSDRFRPATVAQRIAPEPSHTDRIETAILNIAARIAEPGVVPINIPSVGLSQSSGAVAHCLWGSVMAMVGKYGLSAEGEPAGGTLRIPGQINAETEVQGLSSRFFFGRIPVHPEGAKEAARRMGLPDEAYELAVRDQPRVALDYSEPEVPYERELIICFGTQFEANMMNRERWLKKLRSPSTTLVVVDPIPDPFTLENAHLVIPSPPHSATPKLYQNGEWRMTLSPPRRKAAEQTRSDATILYDTMAEISRRIRSDSMLRMVHPDLGLHSQSGYLRQRFEAPEQGGGLPRFEGEVCRAHLWQRVLSYLADADDRQGELYCMPRDEQGIQISWARLLEEGNLIYGGVGNNRFLLDYEAADALPFKDIYGRAHSFHFFTPTEEDLSIPAGIVLNSGRASMTGNRTELRYAIDTFNSGKATPPRAMPDEHPLHLSLSLCEELSLSSGQSVLVRNPETGQTMTCTVQPNQRLVGKLAYFPFHKDKLQLEGKRYINTVTSHVARCPYTAQSRFKATEVAITKL